MLPTKLSPSLSLCIPLYLKNVSFSLVKFTVFIIIIIIIIFSFTIHIFKKQIKKDAEIP